MGSIVIQPQHDPLFGSVDAEEACSSDADMQALCHDVFDLQGGHHVDPKDEYGQKMIEVPVSVQGSLDQGKYERHLLTLGMADGRSAKGMIVIGPGFKNGGVAFGDSNEKYLNLDKDMHLYVIEKKNSKQAGKQTAGLSLGTSTYWIEDGKIRWIDEDDKKGDSLGPKNVGQAAYDALFTYIDSRDGEGNRHKKITIQDTASLYDFHRAKFNSQIKNKAAEQEITFTLSDMLVPSWFGSADDAASTVALVRFGFLNDAKTVDIMNQKVTFATANAAEIFVKKIFGVDKRTTLGAKSDDLANGAQATTGERPENIDQTYTTPSGGGWHFWFYEGDQITTSVMDDGSGTQDNVIWSIAEYDDVRHAMEEPVEDFRANNYAGLGEMPEDLNRCLEAVSLPILTPIGGQKARVYDGPDVYKFYLIATQISDQKDPLHAFKVPKGWRLPTPEELTAFNQQSIDVPSKYPNAQLGTVDPLVTDFGEKIEIVHDEFMLRQMHTVAGNAVPVVFAEAFYLPITPEQKLDDTWHNIDEWLTYDEAYAVESLCKLVRKEGYEVEVRRHADEGFKYEGSEKQALYAMKCDKKIYTDAAQKLRDKLATKNNEVLILENGMAFSRSEVDELIKALESAGESLWEDVSEYFGPKIEGALLTILQLSCFAAAIVVVGAAVSQIPGIKKLIGRQHKDQAANMREADANSPAEAIARRKAILKNEKAWKLLGESAVEEGRSWYVAGQKGRTQEMRRALEYFYVRAMDTQELYSHKMGALVADPGAGKDTLANMLGLALRIGYYPDGTRVEAKYLQVFGDVARINPAEVVTAHRPSYEGARLKNVQELFILEEEYHKQTGKRLILFVTEGNSGLKQVVSTPGKGLENDKSALDDVFKTEDKACVMVALAQPKGTEEFYGQSAGSNPEEIKRRFPIMPLGVGSETEYRVALAATHGEAMNGNWDLEGNIHSRSLKRIDPNALPASIPPDSYQGPLPKPVFDPLKISEGRRPKVAAADAGVRTPTPGPGGSSGPSSSGAPPPPSGSPPPAPRSSAPPGSSASATSAATFAPKLTLPELAQLFPQLRQPFANPQVAIQAITQNLSEAQRMVWTQRICPEGLPLPQSSYEIALRLQRVVGEQNAQMIFARSLFFCRSGTISSPALGVMLMKAAEMDSRSLSDPTRIVVQAEQIVANYERLVEEKRGRGEKIEEEARRAETWRRELERQKMQRERAVALPI